MRFRMVGVRILTLAEGGMPQAKRARNRTLRDMSMLGRLASAKPPGSCVPRHTPGRSSSELNALSCPGDSVARFRPIYLLTFTG